MGEMVMAGVRSVEVVPPHYCAQMARRCASATAQCYAPIHLSTLPSLPYLTVLTYKTDAPRNSCIISSSSEFFALLPRLTLPASLVHFSIFGFTWRQIHLALSTVSASYTTPTSFRIFIVIRQQSNFHCLHLVLREKGLASAFISYFLTL